MRDTEREKLMKQTVFIMMSLLLSACVPGGTSTDAKFYNLKAENKSVISHKYKQPIGVLRVQMPNFADRPQIVSQFKGKSEVIVSEFDRWVEPLSVLYTRVIAENLNNLLPNAPVKISSETGSADRNVLVHVIKTNSIWNDKSRLDAWYTVKTGDGKSIKRQKFSGEVSITNTYESLVEAQNKLLEDLSYSIAETLVNH